MKIFTFISLKSYLLLLITFCALGIQAQEEKSTANPTAVDSTNKKLNMDAVYSRPMLTSDKSRIAIGGYLEANSIYENTDGVSEGTSFQLRRMTMFMSTTIKRRLSFLSEIEFEEGGHEINIEFAAMDVMFNPSFNFRGGIIMNPIGAFNQNHDGPKWEFIERPTSAVNMLPATFSNAGFGIHGKFWKNNWVFGYEGYLSNGFDNTIIDNEESKTFLPAAKANSERFEESNNGEPLFTGKIAIKNTKIGELGLSYMNGIYNKFQEDGVVFDSKRRLSVFAIDFNSVIAKTGTKLIGEVAFISVDVPDTYTEQFGSKQFGGFFDVIQPIMKKDMFDWKNATINLAMRLDYVDWNQDSFKSTNGEIGDDLLAITPAVSLRPSEQTVFRLNYRYQWQHDILNNPAAKTASWLLGFSTYF